jgi:hypothetical protein
MINCLCGTKIGDEEMQTYILSGLHPSFEIFYAPLGLMVFHHIICAWVSPSLGRKQPKWKI